MRSINSRRIKAGLMRQHWKWEVHPTWETSKMTKESHMAKNGQRHTCRHKFSFFIQTVWWQIKLMMTNINHLWARAVFQNNNVVPAKPTCSPWFCFFLSQTDPYGGLQSVKLAKVAKSISGSALTDKSLDMVNLLLEWGFPLAASQLRWIMFPSTFTKGLLRNTCDLLDKI